jgi:hypothetical protein
MKSARLGFLALSACSVLFLGCPTPVDMHDPDAGGGSGSGGRTGSGGTSGGTGGSSPSGSGGSSPSGTGGSSPGTGGSARSGGTSGSTGGTSGGGGTGGTSGGSGGMAGGDAGGGSEMGAAVGTKVPADVQAVFMKCGTTCHGGNWGDATKSLARLKGNAMCNMTPRMKVNDGAGSLVVQKLKGAVNGCGARMPLNLPALSAAEIMTVEAWITAGAKPVP